MPSHGKKGLTEKDFFQPLLPTPEITNVTLEYITEAPPNILVNDPHIDVGGSPLSEDFGGAIDVERMSARERAAMRSRTDKRLKITYDLVIKEPDINSPFSVLGNDLILNSMYIRVFLVQNDFDSYEKIADGRTTPDVANLDPSILSDSFSFTNFKGAFTTGKSRTIEVTKDGTRVFVYSKRKSFEENPTTGAGLISDMDNLGIVVYSYFDPSVLMGDIAALRGTDPATSSPVSVTSKNLESRRDSLLVLDGGQVSSTTSIFTDLSGNIWTGPIHKTEPPDPNSDGVEMTDDELRKKINNLNIEMAVINQAILEISDGVFVDTNWFYNRFSELGAEVVVVPKDLSFPKGLQTSSDAETLNFALDTRAAQLDNLNSVLSSQTSDRIWEWATGPAPSPEKIASGMYKPLNKTIITIPKVQDFRTRDIIDEIQFDYTTIINSTFTNIEKNLTGERIVPDKANAYFSDMFLSRDFDDNCRFFFTCDWKRILIDNSFFGKLFERANSQEQANLLLGSGIQGMRIFRKRLEGSSEAIGFRSALKKTKLFDENEISETIATTKETSQSHPLVVEIFGDVDPSDPGNSFGEVVGSEIRLLDDAEANAGRQLRHFTGVDRKISKVTDGYYHYGVEVDILDGSVNIIKNKLNRLLNYIEGLKIYYQDAIGSPPRANSESNITPQYSPYVDTPGETGDQQPGEIRLKMNFDVSTNKFSADFIRNYTEGEENLFLARTFGVDPNWALKNAVTNKSAESPGYIQILKLFTDLSPKNQAIITNNLLDYLNPNSGSPDSIGVVIKLMETLASKIEVVLGTVAVPRSGVDGNVISFVPKPADQSVKNRTFKIQHDFSEIFNANLQHKLGFDFLGLLDLETPSALGLPSQLLKINTAGYDRLITQEREKIFSSARPGVAWNSDTNLPQTDISNTEGTYFTPTTIYIPDEEFGISINSETPSDDYLKPLSWSLYGKRTPADVVQRLGPGTWAKSLMDLGDDLADSILANDLASYFANNHSTVIVTSRDNKEEEWGKTLRVFAKPRTSTRVESDSEEEGTGDTFNRTMYQEIKRSRDVAYEFFLAMLQQTEFDPDNKQKVTKLQELITVDSYDLTNPRSKISRTKQRLQGRFLGSVSMELLGDDLPQQVTSLVYRTSNNPDGDGVTATGDLYNDHTWDLYEKMTSQNIMNNRSLYPEFVFKTQIINQVEVLVGYDRAPPLPGKTEGELLLKKPRWKKIKTKAQDWRSQLAGGQQFLCRQVPYTNSTLMVKGNKNFELPTYGEFFMYQK